MTDYTQLPLGTKIDDGVAEICPHCQRVGVTALNQGVKVWNHKMGAVLDNDKILRTVMEWCPQDLPKDVNHKPKDIID
jgi:hypothetical protein